MAKQSKSTSEVLGGRPDERLTLPKLSGSGDTAEMCLSLLAFHAKILIMKRFIWQAALFLVEWELRPWQDDNGFYVNTVFYM